MSGLPGQAPDAYERFGTDADKNNTPLRPGDPKPLDELRPHERAVYHRLLDPGHRRIEQERIPLDVALAAVR